MKVPDFRKTTWMVAAGLLVTAGTLVVADMAWSQPDGGRRGRVGRRGGPGGPGGGGLAIPLGQFGLSEEQRDEVRGVLAESREALREAGEQMRASRQALRDAAGTGGEVNEDAIRAAAAELGTATGAVALERASARARIWQALTPDQRTAADVLRAAREQRMAERRERWEERRGRRDRWEGRRGRGRD
jgi:Spy/CpxP family protein refolding chaperone